MNTSVRKRMDVKKVIILNGFELKVKNKPAFMRRLIKRTHCYYNQQVSLSGHPFNWGTYAAIRPTACFFSILLFLSRTV